MTDRYTTWVAMLAQRDVALVSLALIPLAFILAWELFAHYRPARWQEIHLQLAALLIVVVYYGSLALLAAGDLAHRLGR